MFIGDDDPFIDMPFKLSLDIGDDDDRIFFYCKSIEELKTLAGHTSNDFIITDFNKFLKKEELC